jgi:hypothetical protein
MDDKSHLELGEIAERSSINLERIAEALRELRRNHDGVAVLDRIYQLEDIYQELSALLKTEQKEQLDAGLKRTQGRFVPATLQNNQKLSQQGFVSLNRVVQSSERAAEALQRAKKFIDESKGFDLIVEEFNDATRRTADALQYAYLITVPEK